MAVEARHLNLFPYQLLPNRGTISTPIEATANMYTTHMGYGVLTTTGETSLPLYNPAVKTESGLTSNLPVSRKRSRDPINPFTSSTPKTNNDDSNSCASFSFLGEDVSIHILQQQLEIDRFIAQHMEKVSLEIEERRKRHSRRLVAAVEEGMMKRLRSKEEEIEKMGKLNWALEERVKSLCIENQIWKELAQTNEATANALRNNLEQALAEVKGVHQHRAAGLDAAETDDAESCCGSTVGGDCEERDAWRMLAENNSYGNDSSNKRWCRNCGNEESSVLLLPCRHLCLCTVCGSTLHICPICKSNKNASVHVNMS